MAKATWWFFEDEVYDIHQTTDGGYVVAGEAGSDDGDISGNHGSAYQYEIRDQSLARSFQYVSYIYDHAWYGEFDLNAREYSRAENALITTSKLAGHG